MSGGTFIYAPGSQIIIGSAQWGSIDVSDDIVSGSVTINTNSQHELSFVLENNRHKYDGVFMPNDRITLKLKRKRWLPIMSGYLNTVPFASTWPGSVSFTASCTLKRPFYRLYDSGAIATTDLFNSFTTGDPDAQGDDGDGGLGYRVQKILTEMGDWPEDKIHIAQLPSQWWQTVSGLWEKIRPTLENSIVDTAASGASVYGSDVAQLPPGVMVGGSPANPSLMGPQSMTQDELHAWFSANAQYGSGKSYSAAIPPERMVALYMGTGRSEGVRPDLAFIQACWETGWFMGTNDVRINNFAGIGHPSGKSQGIAFDTPQDGVLAHVQLLKRAAMGNDAAVASFANKNMEVRWAGRVGPLLSDIAASYAEDGSYFVKVTAFWQAALTHAKRTQNNGTTFNSGGSGGSGGGSGTSSTGTGSTLAQAVAKAGASTAQGAGTAAGKWVFPVPGGTYSQDSYGQWRNANGKTDSHRHAGVDISAPQGTPIYAVVGGTCEVPPKSNSAGNYVIVKAADGAKFRYLHMMDGGVLVSPGQVVKAGQQIGKVGATGCPDPTAYHLHFEWRPQGGDGFEGTQNPNAMLGGANPDGGTAAVPLLTANADTYEYTDLSASLIGPRMLLNDQGSSVLSLVESFVTAGMREYCSAPNGDFISWFPDYFGNYGKAAKFVLEDIELTDFTLDWSDDGMVTHQFVVGSIGGYNAEVQPDEAVTKMLTTMGVATIEFPEILEAIVGADHAEWMTADALMERFGPRVDKQDYAAVVTPEAEFYMAVKLFMENWAKQFRSTVTISFMPELWPGMLLQIPSRGIQFYIEQVSHNWSYTSGFSTSVGICAPAAMNGKFTDLLPKAGALNIEVMD